MAQSENHVPSNFQKLYDSLTLTEKLSVDSAVKMNFLLFQCIHETFMRQMQLNKNNEKEQ